MIDRGTDFEKIVQTKSGWVEHKRVNWPVLVRCSSSNSVVSKYTVPWSIRRLSTTRLRRGVEKSMWPTFISRACKLKERKTSKCWENRRVPPQYCHRGVKLGCWRCQCLSWMLGERTSNYLLEPYYVQVLLKPPVNESGYAFNASEMELRLWCGRGSLPHVLAYFHFQME